jgi:hypothetical protein
LSAFFGKRLQKWVTDNAAVRIQNPEEIKNELVELGVFVDKDAADEFNYSSISTAPVLLQAMLSHKLCKAFLWHPYWICGESRVEGACWLQGRAKSLWMLENELYSSKGRFTSLSPRRIAKAILVR